MSPLKSLLAACFLVIIVIHGTSNPARAAEQATATIIGLDPASGATLGTDDKLYIRLRYQSDIPLRFLVNAYFDGVLHEVGAMTNAGALHAAGSGEALAWITFSNPTHIDQIGINLLNAEWQKFGSLTAEVDLRWESSLAGSRHTPAAWVEDLGRAEQRKRDYLHDPAPNRYGDLADFLFLLTVISAPVYLLVQIQMLRVYRGRWRELAAIPLVTAMPLVIYGALIGYGIDANLWLALIFRSTPFALLYLLTLWVIKRIRSPQTTAHR